MLIALKAKSNTKYHSPCQTPYTALWSLLSVALSSVTAKSNYIIPCELQLVNIQFARNDVHFLRFNCSILAELLFNLNGLGVF